MSDKTTVVNLTLEKCDVKICRGKNGKIPDPPEYGCFGNPYFLRDKNNEQERKIVIEKYRQYFNHKIKDPDFRNAILSLKGKKLGCFCKSPDKEVVCHGDVIAEWLNSQFDK